MLERRSALAGATPYKSSVLAIAERPGFTLTQLAGLDGGFEAALTEAIGAVPAKVGIASEGQGRTLMRVGPSQVWVIGPEADDVATRLAGRCAVTPLSHSRTRIGLSGVPVRTVLAKGIPLDFHARAFTPGMFAMTGLHHTPVTVQCVAEDGFELYVMRTFALDVWEWLVDAALEFSSGD